MLEGTHENQRQDFSPPSLGAQPPHRIRQLVQRERFRNRTRGGEGSRQIVEAISDGNLLHQIAFVQNIGSGGRNENVDDIFRVRAVLSSRIDRLERGVVILRRGDRRMVSHLTEEGDNGGWGEGETGAGVDVGWSSEERSRCEDRSVESSWSRR